MTDAETLRFVELARTGDQAFVATNKRGGTLSIGGEDADFTPVELLLVAIAGCSALDIDAITAKRATPDRLDVRAEGHKIRDEQGNRMVDLRLLLDVAFPEGEGGDAAREFLPRAIEMTRDRLCTVSRTVAVGAPVEFVERGEA